MKILVTGGYGQLGNEVVRALREMRCEIGPVPEAYRGAQVVLTDADTLDIADAGAVEGLFAREGFDLAVNCAAYTNVDACEANEALAWRVNALGPENLARACAAHGAKLVHVSTDYVFPGNVPGERVETDPTGPLSAYGRTKLAGEELVAAACPAHFIFRTAWLYGYVGKNFVKTMRRLGAERASLTVVDDQLGNPTSANDLAYHMLKVAVGEGYGTYHCTNAGTVSWCGFAKAIMEGSGLACEVVPVTSEQYKAANPASADRPRFSALRNLRLEQTVGDEMRPWQEALAQYLQNLPVLEG